MLRKALVAHRQHCAANAALHAEIEVAMTVQSARACRRICVKGAASRVAASDVYFQNFGPTYPPSTDSDDEELH